VELYKVTEEYYRSVFAVGKYERIYRIGKIVTSDPLTLGLMCFDTLENAIKFKSYSTKNGVILLVKALDNIGKVRRVSRFLNESAMDDYYDLYTDTIIKNTVPPCGTVCCSSVKVIRAITDLEK